MFLDTKPDYDKCVERVCAWFNAEIIDRVPVRFHRHNAEYDHIIGNSGHASLRDRWMDAEFQASSFLGSVKGKTFLGETFPVYMPNLGPNFFAAIHGAELEFGETTTWCEPSVTWMNLPVPNGRMHIPSNDFSFMISPELFSKYALQTLKNEISTMTHNVFHVDGQGVANHTDDILSTGIKAIQWVQGVADDYPVMQHVPYIKYLQSKGASVIVDLDLVDLDKFIHEVAPKGIFLWIATANREQEVMVLKKLMRWK